MGTDSGIIIWKLSPQESRYIVDQFTLGCPANSLDDASKILPGGVYTTLRTYSRTKVMCIKDHFQRIEDSAQRVSAGFTLHAASIRQALKLVMNESPYPESRVRVTLDLENEPGCFYVSLEMLHLPPDSAYLDGVKVISRGMQRSNPKAKMTKFIETASKYRAQLPPGVNEMLMLDPDGVILEGLSSNFFGVKAGTIWTVEEGVLLGITRGAVLEIAKNNQIPIKFAGIPISHLGTVDECFITSASRGVLPVVKIDETTIGNGKPGKWSGKFIDLFNQWIEKNVEEI